MTGSNKHGWQYMHFSSDEPHKGNNLLKWPQILFPHNAMHVVADPNYSMLVHITFYGPNVVLVL